MLASSLPALLGQFQTRYPIGSLSAELLTIHQEQYVVRAIVQMGGATLATSMAAASTLEAAEDRAKLRVLESLIVPQQPAILPAMLSHPSHPLERSPEPEPIPTAPIAPAQPLAAYRLDYLSTALPAPVVSTTLDTAADDLPAAVAPVSLTAPFPPAISAMTSADVTDDMELPTAASPPTWEAEFQSVSQLSSTVGSTIGSTAHSTAEAVDAAVEVGSAKTSAVTSGLRTSKTERASKRPAEASIALATEPASPEPADRSEEIMRIGIEMKRLGWSTEQGREYLKRTYGKSSRSKLDDAELLDFLHYLEIQSSPLQTPF
jgi:hypothetical protein